MIWLLISLVISFINPDYNADIYMMTWIILILLWITNHFVEPYRSFWQFILVHCLLEFPESYLSGPSSFQHNLGLTAHANLTCRIGRQIKNGLMSHSCPKVRHASYEQMDTRSRTLGNKFRGPFNVTKVSWIIIDWPQSEFVISFPSRVSVLCYRQFQLVPITVSLFVLAG